MKFRTKMILAYTTVALLVSLVLGLVIYGISSRNEMNTQKNSLAVSARSLVSQMDDRLGRMDAILYYILSDPAMLESMNMLSEATEQELVQPDKFMLASRSDLLTGISTEYIMENSYRSVFFAENGYFISSAVKQIGDDELNQRRLIDAFDLGEIPYLDPVIAGNGHSVIVGVHPDFWGAYGNVPVYSLMKAPRIRGLGFIEVENRIDSLKTLEISDEDIRFAILVNGDELLHADVQSEMDGKKLVDIVARLDEEVRAAQDGNLYATASSAKYDLTVLTFKSAALIQAGRSRIFYASFLAACATFGISMISIFIWSYFLTRPVRQLQQIVEDTSIENLLDENRNEQIGRINERKGPDEFAHLARAYQAMTVRLDKALTNEKRASMLQLQAQFDTLQTQVNPHFIYNVLNIISSRAVMADDEVICEMCGCLGSMLRYSTNNKERYARISDELEYLHSYFYLLKSRYEDRLQIVIDVDEEVKRQVIPKMTLQQIVENSVKHGYHETDVDMRLTLTGRMQADGWLMTIRDNGSGASAAQLAEVHDRLEQIRMSFLEKAVPTEAQIGGIGLANTYARCLLLYQDSLIFEADNAQYGEGFEVKVGVNESGGQVP